LTRNFRQGASRWPDSCQQFEKILLRYATLAKIFTRIPLRLDWDRLLA